MTNSNTVRLVAAGVEYAGWKEVEITPGIERAARDFTLEVTSRWPGAAATARRIRPGDPCEVYIGDDKVLTGFADATPIRYDARTASVSVVGRSKTADLVDCSAESSPGQWRGLTVDKIVAALAKPYGIEVVAAASVGAALADHQVQPGETVFESVERLQRARQLLVTDDAAGRLVLTRPGTERAHDALVLGENILQCDAPMDFRDVYSHYITKGQKPGTDDSYGDDCSTTATELEPNVARRRVLVIRQTGQGDAGSCARRAKYERARRMGKALERTYTVQGWRQSNGALWVPNLRVLVRDAIAGIDREMLIAEVAYKIGDAGTTAQLRVGLPESYEPEPPEAKKAKKASEADSLNGIDEYRNYYTG